MRASSAFVLLLLAGLFWGAGNIAQKSVLDHVGPLTAIALRSLIAAVVLVPFVYRERQGFARLHSGTMLPFVASIICFALATTCYQIAFGGTSVTNAGFLVNICCVMTPILAWLMLRTAPGTLTFPAAFIALIGIVLMSGPLEELRRGDATALLAAFFYALWAVFVGMFLARSERPMLLIFSQLCATAVIASATALWLEQPTLAAVQGAGRHLLFLGIIATAVPYTFQIVAQQHVSATIAMLTVSSEAVFGAVFAMVLLGEQPTLLAYAGAALVILAINLVCLPEESRAARFVRRFAMGRTSARNVAMRQEGPALELRPSAYASRREPADGAAPRQDMQASHTLLALRDLHESCEKHRL
jgi:drug/metabolite transporter (DMT)-like permease